MERKGALTVIYGPMFSGKSTELLNQIDRAEHAERTVVAFTASIDDRYGERMIANHNGHSHGAIEINIDNPFEIIFELQRITEEKEINVNMIAIDETQFFALEIIGVIDYLLDQGIDVCVAGLPTDFRNEPFGAMPNLMARADETIQRTAICKHRNEDGQVCGCDATRTQRLVNGQPADYRDPVIMVGAVDSYEARCSNHHIVPNEPILDL